MNERIVTVEDVVPIGITLPQDKKASFPSLISFRVGRDPTYSSKVDLKLRKRRRVQPDENETEADDADDAKTELFAEAKDGRVWHAEEGFHELFSQHFIGIRSKSTGKMRLVQINAMYGLRPYISQQAGSGFWEEKDGEKDAEEHNDNEKSSMQKRLETLEAFGAKRSINRLTRFERNRITDDKIDDQAAIHINQAGLEMFQKDAGVGIHHNSLDTTESSAPPHNTNATTPEDAYPLLGLISPQEFSSLEDSVSLLIDTMQDSTEESRINPGWHPLVWDVLSSILTSTDGLSDVMRMRMCCAMHLHYLITLKNSRLKISSSVRQQLLEKMAVSDAILTLILQRFTVLQAEHGRRQARVISSENSSQIVNHAIIMWMYAHGFKNCGQLNHLANALGITFKVLVWQAASIGCKVQKVKDMEGGAAYRVSLKTPLVFPPLRRKKYIPKKR